MIEYCWIRITLGHANNEKLNFICSERPSSMVISRSKKVLCLPWSSTFYSSSLDYTFLKDEKNSGLLFTARRSSNQHIFSSWGYQLNKLLNILRLKKINWCAQNGAGSVPIGIPKFHLNSVLPILKQHFLVSYETTLPRVFQVCYLFPQPLDVQYRDVEEIPTQGEVLDLKKKSILSERTLIKSYKELSCKVCKSQRLKLLFSLHLFFSALSNGNEDLMTQNFLKLEYNQLLL